MPSIRGYTPADMWEREVLNEMKKRFPADWTVVSNVSYMWTDSSFRRDGQVDFVVLVPNVGMAIVEVKGSRGIVIDEEGRWLRRERDGRYVILHEPPPEQASRNCHNLRHKISSLLGEKDFPGLYGWLVVYPNGNVQGSLDMYYPDTVLEKKNLYKLKNVILSVLNGRGPARKGAQFTQSVMEKTEKYLTNGYFVVEPVDTESEAREDSLSIDQLTRQQYNVMKGVLELPSVAVAGPAGSGKTLIAIWKLQDALANNLQAVYVCFNKSLREFLSTKYPALSDSIKSVDKLFIDLTGGRPDSSDDYFTKTLPNKVDEYSWDMNNKKKYDLIIIDEGQDFGDERILALHGLLKEGTGQWLMFYDRNQNLYQSESEPSYLPEVTFRLYHNCRNPSAVNETTNSVCHTEVISSQGVPVGIAPTFEYAPLNRTAEFAWSKIRDLYPDGGSVILSPRKLTNSCMNHFKKAFSLTLTQDVSKIGCPGFVVFQTIKSFKGLEGEHIVLIEVEEPQIHSVFTPEDAYVAFTRATSRLDVITSSQESLDWFKSAVIV